MESSMAGDARPVRSPLSPLRSTSRAFSIRVSASLRICAVVMAGLGCRVGRVFEAHHAGNGGPRRLDPPYGTRSLTRHERADLVAGDGPLDRPVGLVVEHQDRQLRLEAQ